MQHDEMLNFENGQGIAGGEGSPPRHQGDTGEQFRQTGGEILAEPSAMFSLSIGVTGGTERGREEGIERERMKRESETNKN